MWKIRFYYAQTAITDAFTNAKINLRKTNAIYF